MDLPYQDLAAQLQEKSYATVHFPLSKKEFEDAIQIYLTFLTLPQDVKDSLYFKINPNERGNEVGYKRYLRELGHTDNREYVHYNERAEKQFADEMMRYPEFGALMSVMRTVYEAAQNTLSEILTSFEPHFPGIHERFFSEYGTRYFFVRFLKYDVGNPGEFLAKGHYDRGTCTLALAESAPGLRIGKDDQTVREIVHVEHQALFMPALRFPAYTENTFHPAWHDVVQQASDTYNKDIARWAIVFFDGSKDEDGGKISYEDAHTPQREQSATPNI